MACEAPFKEPLPVLALCCLEHVRLQVRASQPGHLYFHSASWQTSHCPLGPESRAEDVEAVQSWSGHTLHKWLCMRAAPVP